MDDDRDVDGQAYTEALEKGDDDEWDREDDDKDDGGCHDEVPDTDLEVCS